jgi:hypothetical protein
LALKTVIKPNGHKAYVLFSHVVQVQEARIRANGSINRAGVALESGQELAGGHELAGLSLPEPRGVVP